MLRIFGTDDGAAILQHFGWEFTEEDTLVWRDDGLGTILCGVRIDIEG